MTQKSLDTLQPAPSLAIAAGYGPGIRTPARKPSGMQQQAADAMGRLFARGR